MIQRRWSPNLVASAMALAGWAGVFWFLIVSNRSSLYLSPRVAWVIPVGAVLLTVFALGQIAVARADHPEPLKIRSAILLSFVLLPAVAIVVLPPTVLGSFAADRRSALTSDAIGATVVRQAEALESPEDGGAPRLEGFEIGLQYVAAAFRSPEAHEALGRLVELAGPRVTYEGFVVRSEAMPDTEFLLSRFIVACCLADAISAQVPVVGAPSKIEQDQWIQVTGDLQMTEEGVILSAVRVVEIEQPENPYLWAR